MAKRFYSEFTSIHNIDYVVEVWDSDFVGSASTFDLGAGGFALSYAGDNNERFATIFASQVEFTFFSHFEKRFFRKFVSLRKLLNSPHRALKQKILAIKLSAWVCLLLS